MEAVQTTNVFRASMVAQCATIVTTVVAMPSTQRLFTPVDWCTLRDYCIVCQWRCPTPTWKRCWLTITEVDRVCPPSHPRILQRHTLPPIHDLSKHPPSHPKYVWKIFPPNLRSGSTILPCHQGHTHELLLICNNGKHQKSHGDGVLANPLPGNVTHPPIQAVHNAH